MNSHAIDRRKFIHYSAVLGGSVFVSFSTGTIDTSAQNNRDSKLFWYRRPLRILQTVLREPDAENYNARAVVRYMEDAGCNTLVVNAGGIVDFFQNPLPAANINTFMGKNDVLRDITSACHDAGFHVIGRVDFRGVEEHIYRQLPEWFSIDENGKPMQLTYTRPQLYSSCYTGYHRNEHAEEFIAYLMENYDLDGIWHNSIGVGGICYCDRCRESFRQFSGKDIPIQSSASDDELNEYMRLEIRSGKYSHGTDEKDREIIRR